MRRRPGGLRPSALLVAALAASAMVLGTLTVAQAGGSFKYKTYKVPTEDSQPRYLAVGPDGNLWFVGSGDVFTPDPDPDMGGTFHTTIGRITPSGDITEFPLDCGSCLLDDIESGADGALFVSTNHSGLWRITTEGAGEFLDVADYALGAITRDGDDLWGSGPSFGPSRLWRYDVMTEEFSEFALPVRSGEVAVDADGIVWFTTTGAIGRFDPADGSTATTPVPDDVSPGGQGATPGQIALSADGKVWFTDRFNHSVGYLDPADDRVTQFATLTPQAGPQDIAAADDGSMWFAQANVGNAARITADGTMVEEGKAVGDDPDSGLENALGIAFRPDPDGPDGEGTASVWFTMQAANEIASLTQN